MIKVNLSTAKKQVNLSNVGGFDFSKFKLKAFLGTVFLIYLIDFTLTPLLEAETQKAQEEVNSHQNELRKLRSEVKESQDLEKQIRELKAQEESLEKKLTAVKEAISEKKNPSALLLYISKNIPKDLWIKDLSIEGDVLKIKGEALDYTSIGNFVNSLRSSIFIKEANITNTTSNVRETDKRRIESFEVKFLIGRFNQ
jgi:Tfp pilus assembly protein PilN